MVLAEVLGRLELDGITISDFGVREGLVTDWLASHARELTTLERVEDLRLRSVIQLAQKFDALDYEFSALYERARLLQDEIAGRMTAITNRRLFTLSVLTACMLPSTLVTGFFGMNTKDMPFQSGDGGTWYALLLVIAAGALT